VLFEPGVEHRIGTTTHSFYPHLSGSRVKQAHEFGRAVSQVLMGLACWLALRLPATSGVGYGLEWTGLVEPPHRDAHLLTLSVSAFDQIF
jgi:hypothetical protein